MHLHYIIILLRIRMFCHNKAKQLGREVGGHRFPTFSTLRPLRKTIICVWEMGNWRRLFAEEINTSASLSALWGISSTCAIYSTLVGKLWATESENHWHKLNRGCKGRSLKPRAKEGNYVLLLLKTIEKEKGKDSPNTQLNPFYHLPIT